MAETCTPTLSAAFDDRLAAAVDKDGQDTFFIGFSLFRIAFGIYLAAELFFTTLPYFTAFYTDEGLYPRSLLIKEFGGAPGNLTLMVVTDYPLFNVLFMGVYALAIFAFIFGYRTRMATVLLLIGFSSLTARNPLITSGGDMLTRLLMLWGCFLPLNRFFSVDAALSPTPRDAPYPVIPLIAIKLQIACIYIFSVCYKFAGKSWLNGDAVWRSLTDNTFGGSDLGLWMLNHMAGQLPIMNYAILVFQASFSLLIYSPWYKDWTRGFALAGAFLMHTAFLFMLNVGFFPYVCWCYLLLLLPDRWLKEFFRPRRERLAKMRIFYEPDCGFCFKTARLLREFCLPATTPIAPASADAAALQLLRANNSWVLYDEHGNARLKWDAVAYVLKQSPVLAPLGWITGAAALKHSMVTLYDAIGRKRPVLSQWTERFLPIRPLKAPGLLMQGLCGFLLYMMLLCNLIGMDKPVFQQPLIKQVVNSIHVPVPLWLSRFVSFVQVRQSWSLFAPNPENITRRIELGAVLEDGTAIDAQTRLPYYIVGMAPNNYQIDFVNHKWLKYFTRLNKGSMTRKDAFGTYLCHEVNRPGTPLPRVREVTVKYDVQKIKDGSPQMVPVMDYNFTCPK